MGALAYTLFPQPQPPIRVISKGKPGREGGTKTAYLRSTTEITLDRLSPPTNPHPTPSNPPSQPPPPPPRRPDSPSQSQQHTGFAAWLFLGGRVPREGSPRLPARHTPAAHRLCRLAVPGGGVQGRDQGTPCLEPKWPRPGRWFTGWLLGIARTCMPAPMPAKHNRHIHIHRNLNQPTNHNPPPASQPTPLQPPLVASRPPAPCDPVTAASTKPTNQPTNQPYLVR